jgi:hypothetical protein
MLKHVNTMFRDWGNSATFLLRMACDAAQGEASSQVVLFYSRWDTWTSSLLGVNTVILEQHLPSGNLT